MSRPIPALFWLSSAAVASAASIRICDPMLPALANDFGTTAAAASIVVTLYTIGYGAAQLVHGPLGDRFGKARYIAGTSLLAAIATLLCALSTDLVMLEYARLLAGTFAAAVVPLALAWVGDSVPYDKRQATLAKFINATILGVILGHVLGGFFADTVGWRWAFVLLSAIFALSGWQLMRAQGSPASRVREAVASDARGMLDAYGVVLRTPWARAILVVVAIEALFVFGSLAFIPTWLHQKAGLPVSLAGAAVASFALGGFVYTTNAARLLRYLGESGLALGGGAIVALGLAAIAAAPGLFSGAVACGSMGLGYYMLHNTLQTHATQMAPAVRGTGVALFAMSLTIGQSIGVATAAETAASAGYVPVFALAAIGLLGTGAGFAALLRYRQRRA